MARLPRSLTVLSGDPVHKVWRSHNGEPNLGTNEEKQAYLDYLNMDLESKRYESGCKLQAVTVMTNHTHEMSHVENRVQYSNHMRRHHSRYGAFFNKLKNRCGKVAQDRPHTTLLESERQEMETVFYIHANPVRARMVGDARDYPWSTHRYYAYGKRESWMRNIKLPGWYLKLGATPELRQRAYRQLFEQYLAERGLRSRRFFVVLFFGSVLWCRERQAALHPVAKATTGSFLNPFR